MIKQCNRCKASKEVTEFPKSSSNKSGYGSPCKECGRKMTKEYNRETNYDVNYRKENRELVSKRSRKSREKYREEYNKRYRDRYKTDPVFKLKELLRIHVKRFIVDMKGKSSYDILGETYDNVRVHIEKQFEDGMDWSNHGEWHIDHIIPLASAKTEEEVIKLNHYTNLQPLWAKDNKMKGAKINYSKE